MMFAFYNKLLLFRNELLSLHQIINMYCIKQHLTYKKDHCSQKEIGLPEKREIKASNGLSGNHTTLLTIQNNTTLLKKRLSELSLSSVRLYFFKRITVTSITLEMRLIGDEFEEIFTFVVETYIECFFLLLFFYDFFSFLIK